MTTNKRPPNDASRLIITADRKTNSILFTLEGHQGFALDPAYIPQLHADIDKALKSLGHAGMPTIAERRAHIQALLDTNPELHRYIGLPD